MKRVMLVLCLVLLAIFTFGNDLTIWMQKTFVAEQNEMFVERAKQFGEENSINVNVSMIAYEDFAPKWAAAIESGNVPDVSYFGYQEVGQFYKQDVLEDLTDLFKDIEKEKGTFFENPVNAVNFDGKIMAIPIFGESIVLYFRKDYLENEGIEGYPHDWYEFKEYSEKITKPKKGIYGAGIGYGAANSDAEWLSRSIIWSFGGSLFDESGKNIVINSEKSIEAIEFIKSIFDENLTPPTAMGWDSGGNNISYVSGQSAFVFNTGSILKSLKSDYPELLEVTGIAPICAGPAGSFIPGISNNLGIFKDSKNKKMAKKFIEYLYDFDWYSSWIDISAPLAVPVLAECENSAIWQDEYNKPFLESMKSFVFLGYKGEYQSAAGEVFNLRLLNTMFENIILKDTSIDKELTNFTVEVESILNK